MILARRIAREIKIWLSEKSRNLRIRLGIDQKIEFDGYEISLPPEHLLPSYLSNHRQYDQFLPYLAKRLSAGDVVVDVGANCGDTLAAMYNRNPKLGFVCIEPDPVFFGYLDRAAQKIRHGNSTAKIDLLMSFVAQDVEIAGLTGAHGTASVVVGTSELQPGDTAIESIQMDDIARHISECSADDIRLIKVDVDGYDYDVIDSARTFIRDKKPLLYFECLLRVHLDNCENYISTIKWLLNAGYTNFWLFDNYGSPVIKTGDIEIIRQMFDYILRQEKKLSSRTVYYFDLLACIDGDASGMSEIVADYANEKSYN